MTNIFQRKEFFFVKALDRGGKQKTVFKMACFFFSRNLLQNCNTPTHDPDHDRDRDWKVEEPLPRRLRLDWIVDFAGCIDARVLDLSPYPPRLGCPERFRFLREFEFGQQKLTTKMTTMSWPERATSYRHLERSSET